MTLSNSTLFRFYRAFFTLIPIGMIYSWSYSGDLIGALPFLAVFFGLVSSWSAMVVELYGQKRIGLIMRYFYSFTLVFLIGSFTVKYSSLNILLMLDNFYQVAPIFNKSVMTAYASVPDHEWWRTASLPLLGIIVPLAATMYVTYNVFSNSEINVNGIRHKPFYQMDQNEYANHIDNLKIKQSMEKWGWSVSVLLFFYLVYTYVYPYSKLNQ